MTPASSSGSRICRNTGSLALRRNDGYGASTLARLWIDK